MFSSTAISDNCCQSRTFAPSIPTKWRPAWVVFYKYTFIYFTLYMFACSKLSITLLTELEMHSSDIWKQWTRLYDCSSSPINSPEWTLTDDDDGIVKIAISCDKSGTRNSKNVQIKSCFGFDLLCFEQMINHFSQKQYPECGSQVSQASQPGSWTKITCLKVWFL